MMVLWELFFEFFKAGLFAVGGGLATLPFLYDIASRYDWMSVESITDMIAISESTPGPLGINMGTYVGYTTAGVAGAVIATLGIVLPTMVLVLIIAGFLQSFSDSKYVKGAMYGLRPASAGLIASAGVSVAMLSFINKAALSAHEWGSVVEPKALVLAAVIFVLTNYVKKTKGLHPVVFIAGAAVVGIVFRFAGA